MRCTLLLASLALASALLAPTGPRPGQAELRPDAALLEGSGRPVFYAIVMNQAAQKHQVRLWLSSLREIGQWKDEVVLVTDRPDCLADNLGSELLGKKVDGDDHVDIYEDSTGAQLHVVKVAPTENVREMKFQKAKAWENIELARIPHPVSSIVYVDMDVVMAKPLDEFVPYVRALEGQGHTLALFRDTGTTGDTSTIHTGVVIIFRGDATDKCLAKWGELLLVEPSMGDLLAQDPHLMDNKAPTTSFLQTSSAARGPDQRALTKSEPCKAGSGIKLMEEKYFYFPPTDQKIDHTAEFVHFTNSHRWKHMTQENLEDYLYGKLGLSREVLGDVMGDHQC